MQESQTQFVFTNTQYQVMPLGAGNSNGVPLYCNVFGGLTQMMKKETQNFYLARKHEYFSSLQCKVTICEEMPPPNPSGICFPVPLSSRARRLQRISFRHRSSPQQLPQRCALQLFQTSGGGGRGRFESSAAETCNKNKDNAIIDEFSIHHSRHTKYHFYVFQSTQSLNSLRTD